MPMIVRAVTARGSMRMGALLDRDGNRAEDRVVDAALGSDRVGEILHGRKIPSQNRDLEAVLVIEMHVQRRDLEVVMRMMRLGQPSRQLTRMMVVNVGQNGDALARDAVAEHSVREPVAGQIPDSLRTVVVPMPPHVPRKLGGEFVRHADGEPFHPCAPSMAVADL